MQRRLLGRAAHWNQEVFRAIHFIYMGSGKDWLEREARKDVID